MMESIVDPTLLAEIRRYGHFDVDACFNCGSCAAVCALSKDSALFPRRSMRFAQLGLREPLKRNLDSWLCYYCGDCSTTCPRQTEPGESMMTLRRWLTAQYDWTGLSRRMYLSPGWELGALAAVGGLVAWLISSFHGPMVLDHVEMNTFAPVWTVHTFDMILVVVLSFFLLSNVARMWWFTMVQGGPGWRPLGAYAAELKTLILHSATQLRFGECGKDYGRWIKHWVLATGYVTMFTLIVGFLWWFQTDNIYPLHHPQRWLGYLATAALLYGTVEILVGRLRKGEQLHKFSDLSDWLFPILLLLTTVTGISLHIFRYAGWPQGTYAMYAIHLVVAVPMLAVEVPFGKWAHLTYRPLAIYFQAVKDNVLRRQLREDAAGAGAESGSRQPVQVG